MQTQVNITPAIMDWIVGQIKFEKIKEPLLIKNIQLWKTGEKQPTFNQVEKLSKITNIPLGYFFLATPPAEDLSLLEYRTVDSYEVLNPSRNLIDTIREMESVQEWMRNYIITSDNDALDFVGSQKNNKNAEDIAQIIRKQLCLPEDWFVFSQNADDSFKRIRMYAEALGVIVMMNGIVGNNTHRKLEIGEFRAFTLIDNYAPLIFINSNDSYNGKLFSLLHEMAHIWLGLDNFFNDRYSAITGVDETETLCNAIAAEILVPQKHFTQKWDEQNDKNFDSKVNSIASYFNCGTTVIARKALTNNLISLQEYSFIANKAIRYFNERQEKKKNDKSGGDYYRTLATRLDRRFLNAIANSAFEGKTLYSEAFRLTHTNRNTFLTLMEKVRGDK